MFCFFIMYIHKMHRYSFSNVGTIYRPFKFHRVCWLRLHLTEKEPITTEDKNTRCGYMDVSKVGKLMGLRTILYENFNSQRLRQALIIRKNRPKLFGTPEANNSQSLLLLTVVFKAQGFGEIISAPYINEEKSSFAFQGAGFLDLCHGWHNS